MIFYYDKGQLDVFIAMNLYRCYRVWLRAKMGKKKRNIFLEESHINIGDFLLAERPIKAKNGIMAIPRRHTQDFHILFRQHEKEIEPEILGLQDGEAFVDVGANVGYYTLKVASMSRGVSHDNRRKIISVEAHPDNYRALCRNITCNGFANITAINKAVWDIPGHLELRQRIQGESGKRRVMTDDPTLCFEDSDTMQQKYEKLSVQTDTIDNIIAENNFDNIGVLKMDVEGAEIRALHGAKKTAEKVRKMIVEAHSESSMKQVASILSDYGYRVRNLKVLRTYEYPFVIGEKI